MVSHSQLAVMLGIGAKHTRLLTVSISLVCSVCVQDTVALDFTVEQDISSGRTPVMVIAYAGTPLSGHVEDMAAIREICNKHKIWMHVQG